MPIKKDDAGRRWVEMEFIVPGTPEQVWEAMATGPGNAAWFTPTEIEERVGGTIRFDFGENGGSAGEVTAWQPPHRFGYVEHGWGEGAPPLATEITVTARSGGKCLVCMVHSLFSSTDDWDDQMEGFESGWPGFFEVLRVYLTHFAGQEAAVAGAFASTQGDALAVWQRLTGALGLAGADVGERRTTPGVPETLAGEVERVCQDRRQRYLLLRLDAPAPGIVLTGIYDAGAAVNASMSLYFYGDGAKARATASETKWKDWFNATFPAAT